MPRLSDVIEIESGKRIDFESNSPNDAWSIGGEHIQNGSFSLSVNPRRLPYEFYCSSKKGKVKEGDTLFVKDGATLGKSMFVAALPFPHMLVNEHVFVLRPCKIHPKYLSFLIQSNPAQFSVWTGVMAAAQPGVGRAFAKSIDVPIADVATQRAIADFLDRETARIDTLIEKKQRLVELLGENIRSVINQATTVGFQGAETKRVGQKWLNEVSQSWRVSPLKWFTRLQSGFAFKADRFGDDGTRLVRMNNLKRGTLDLDEAVCIADEDVNTSVSLREGDIVIGMSGSIGETGSLGNFAVVSQRDLPCLLNQRVGRFQIISNELRPEYLLLVIQSSSFLDPIFLGATSTAQFNISPSQIGSVLFALPPVEEQTSVVSEVAIRTERLNKVKVATSTSIDRLKEYRSALITSAVTGQIDVTKWTNAGTTDRQLDAIEEEFGA